MKKISFRRTLAVILAVFSSVAAMGQQTKGETDWMKELSSRITLNGYAQAGCQWKTGQRFQPQTDAALG